MTVDHDPLCPWRYPLNLSMCKCTEYAKVRADERARIALLKDNDRA